VVASFHALLVKLDHYLAASSFAFISIKPSPARWQIIERIELTNDRIRLALAGRALSTYVDVFQPMLNKNGLPRPELFEADGLHLSAAGYRLWTKVLWTYRPQIF
jgi:hypothetical protein